MSITDELREWMFDHTVNCSDNRIALVAIADRIDAEHESKVSYWQGASYKDGYDEGFASADDYFTDKRKTLEEHGWVKLPVDADGVPIRVGDRVTMQLLFGGESKPLVVDRMELSHGRDGDLWYIALDTDKECWNQPSLMRHYTPPTVEDVLTELEGMRGNGKTYEDVVMRCADLAGILRELLAGEDA